MIFSSSKDKSFKHERDGDKYCGKKDFKKALEAYRKALEIDDTRVPLYDKFLAVLDQNKSAWSEEDFADSVYWSMKKQEASDPSFRRINARSTPEFRKVIELIKKMMNAKTPEEETARVEDIVAQGTHAIYPLIDFLLTFKEIGVRSKKMKIPSPAHKIE